MKKRSSDSLAIVLNKDAAEFKNSKARKKLKIGSEVKPKKQKKQTCREDKGKNLHRCRKNLV